MIYKLGWFAPIPWVIEVALFELLRKDLAMRPSTKVEAQNPPQGLCHDMADMSCKALQTHVAFNPEPKPQARKWAAVVSKKHQPRLSRV